MGGAIGRGHWEGPLGGRLLWGRGVWWIGEGIIVHLEPPQGQEYPTNAESVFMMTKSMFIRYLEGRKKKGDSKRKSLWEGERENFPIYITDN